MFKMPNAVSITGRSSSITNSFVNAIIPIFPPTKDEVTEALAILGMAGDAVVCSYCGDTMTEWDHLRPLVKDKRPTGYVSEIANLVPACGKCNQSKGAAYWKDWMLGSARLSPSSRGIADLDNRIRRLEAYEQWREPRLVDFAEHAGEQLWIRHWQNHSRLMELMAECQLTAEEIREAVRSGSSPSPGALEGVSPLTPLVSGVDSSEAPEFNRMTKQMAALRACANATLAGVATLFANVNAAKDVWWLDLPLRKLQAASSGIDLLLFDARTDELHHLHVPIPFIIEKLDTLSVRADKDCIHLELRASEPGRFMNVIPVASGVDFRPFVLSSTRAQHSCGVLEGQSDRIATEVPSLSPSSQDG